MTTSLVQAQNLFETNLAAFEKYNPDIYQIILSHKPSSKLVFDKHGSPDVIVDGKKVYGGRAKECAREQLDKFFSYPTHVAGNAPPPGSLDRYGNPLIKKVLDRAKSEGVKLGQEFQSGDEFLLVVFGIGLGFQIDELVEKLDPVFLLFIEPNIDNFYHSLHVYPWHKLMAHQAAKYGAVIITFDRSPEIITTHIQRMIQDSCPPAVDGMAWFLYSDPETAQGAVENFLKNADEVMKGLGGLFDETVMLRNSYLNLKSGSPRIFTRNLELDIESPVFIVGAGPSLDKDLEVLRANAHKAIIISTGTAIRSLLVNGITPDIHVELENLHVNLSIAALSKEFDLSPICLMVTSSVDSEIIKYFNEVIYYFRSANSPRYIFSQSDDETLRVSGPLVVNASFGLALDIGARDIYLFGTDFGTYGDGLHHARDNVLFTEGAVAGLERKFNILVPANFGGNIFVSDDFFWGLKVIQESISFYGRGRRIFNCSDGAYIEGSTPVRSKSLNLKGNSKQKQRDIQRIYDRSPRKNSEWFDRCWDAQKLSFYINTFIDEALTMLDDAESFLQKRGMSRYSNLTKRTPNANIWPRKYSYPDLDVAAAMLFRGTLDSVFIAIRYYQRRVRDAHKRRRFNEILIEELISMIESMRKVALSAVADPASVLPSVTDSKVSGKYFIVEAPATWGHTPRNANCPCGSGLRFKHCHGKND